MSGTYRLRCAACETWIDTDTRDEKTIQDTARFASELEALHKRSDLDLSDLRGRVYEHAAQIAYFVIDHWRHGSLYMYYDCGGVPGPDDWERVEGPPDAGIPAPCSSCHGRRLVPCPAC